jgi:LuxR family transcriptional regulator, maltose regulon positive regulatory protein
MGLDLEASDIATLQNRTEGWIAGLQLAGLSLQGRTDTSRFLAAAFSGSHRYVLDYLSEEVLSRQTAAAQQFLLHTCLLERLSGPLCDAVTAQEGSQAMLEDLERANLFVIPLDEKRNWYRYHHLFAEVLRRHLQQREPTSLPDTHTPFPMRILRTSADDHQSVGGGRSPPAGGRTGYPGGGIGFAL